MNRSENYFRVGTYQLHGDPNFNYQLNRTYTWSQGDLLELKKAAAKITDSTAWTREMLAIAHKAMKEERIEQAIGYWRMAEFFMYDGEPEKIKTYDQAIRLFYDHYAPLFESGIVKRDKVPYESGFLPVLYTEPEGESADIILLQGGFDSYMEEFLPMILYLREKGFTVYLFEGPGQGAVIRKQGIPFTHEWHKPVKAILDHFELNEVTLIGLSLGAILVSRAAACEKRVQRVIAWSVMISYFDSILASRPKKVQKMTLLLMKLRSRSAINYFFRKMMEREPIADWNVRHGGYNMGVKTPYDYLAKVQLFEYKSLAAAVTQDYLLIGAQKDHFLDMAEYKRIIDALTNVKSMTLRLFTAQEHAENHCNAGNGKLVLDTIISWINTLKNREDKPDCIKT